MATIDITEQSFTETLENNEIVFVDFWAAWCGPCPMFAPTYEAAAERHPDITSGKVDTEAEQSLAASGEHHFHSHTDGLQGQNAGLLPAWRLNATGLEEVTQAVKNADIDELRAEAAQQQP